MMVTAVVFSVLAFRCETVSLGNSDGLPGGAELRNSSSFGLLEHPENKAPAKIPATRKRLVRPEQEFAIGILYPTEEARPYNRATDEPRPAQTTRRR